MSQQIVATFEYPLAAVTPEMIAAGAAAWTTCEDLQCLQHVYRAMAALAPVEFCPEDRIAKLERGLDGWQESAAQFFRNQLYYSGLVDEIGALLGPAAMTQDGGNFTGEVPRAKVVEVLAATLAARDAALTELATLRTRLAERDASLVKAARGRV